MNVLYIHFKLLIKQSPEKKQKTMMGSWLNPFVYQISHIDGNSSRIQKNLLSLSLSLSVIPASIANDAILPSIGCQNYLCNFHAICTFSIFFFLIINDKSSPFPSVDNNLII